MDDANRRHPPTFSGEIKIIGGQSTELVVHRGMQKWICELFGR